MDIVFSGICCFVDAASPAGGKTVIVRNALQGGTHRGNVIPPHYAFLHAKREHVDTSNWGSGWLASEDNIILWLTGDRLTFDPIPSGGAIDISQLPHVVTPGAEGSICPAADEIRPGFRDNPTATRVLALVDLPADAPVSCGTNVRGAAYATLHMGQRPVTITATPFADGTGVVRSVTITDPDAQIFVSNVDINGYLIGEGAPDDDHKYLICELFRPAMARVAGEPQPLQGSLAALAQVETGRARSAAAFDEVSLGALRRAAGRGMPEFLSTFAAGCSASQWP